VNLKKLALWLLFLGYMVLIYFLSWETATDVSDIRRLRHYEGEIISFSCDEVQVHRGDIVTKLYVYLSTKKQLKFTLPNKKCSDFYELVPQPIHAEFNAYFTSGSIKSLYVDGQEMVNFEERKSYARLQAFIFWLSPVVIYLLHILHRKWYKKRKGVYPEESLKNGKNPYW